MRARSAAPVLSVGIAVADAAGGRPQQRGQDADEGGLPRPVRAEDAENLALRRANAHARERAAAAEGARHLFDGDDS